MADYDGSKFRALFHSEISSSFILYEVFNNHKELAKKFLEHFLAITLNHSDIYIDRERSYPGKGAIDLFFSFENNGEDVHVLLEVKVHDYLSATRGQITTYYEAARDELNTGKIHFIYLTEFNAHNFPTNENITPPATLQESEDSQHHLGKENVTHISWKEFHEFISPFVTNLQKEEQLMLELQKNWITAKVCKDLEDNAIDVGERDILDYFDDITVDLEQVLPFGKKVVKNKRLIYVIDMTKCRNTELDEVLDVIQQFSKSNKLNKGFVKPTEDATLAAVGAFLGNLAQDETNWKLVSFYSTLFDFVNTTAYMVLHGTGSRGFSIKVPLKDKGTISLCTLWKNKTIEFSLKR